MTAPCFHDGRREGHPRSLIGVWLLTLTVAGLMTLPVTGGDGVSRAAGWITEDWSSAATAQLKQFAKPSESGALFAPKAEVGRLWPLVWTPLKENGQVTVRSALQEALTQPVSHEPETATGALFEQFTNGRPTQMAAKIVGVDPLPTKEGDPPSSSRFKTRSLMAFVGEIGGTGKGSAEWHSTWEIEWIRVGQSPPLITKLVTTSFVESRVKSRPEKEATLFREATAEILGGAVAPGSQLGEGRPHWLKAIPTTMAFRQNTYQGVAVADVDGDGLEDLYLCQGAGLPNRLFTRRADGSVVDTSAAAGVDLMDRTRAALFVDLDNDGDPDLALTTSAGLLLFENNGQGQFAMRSALRLGEDLFSVTAADLDLDGRPDLYVCGYYGSGQNRYSDRPAPFPVNDAENGGRNRLLRNEIPRGGGGVGEWAFRDITKTAGLDENNHRFSMACAFEDYDRDGDLDLYVANDFGKNHLYVNETPRTQVASPDGGRWSPPRFRDRADALGVEDPSFGMSATWGDPNRDGWSDLYVSNMFSSAGSRITGQSHFRGDRSKDDREAFRYLARGNSLFFTVDSGKEGEITFADGSAAAGVLMGRWAWASKFADLNNDGWEDLVVANGYLTNTNSDDL